MLFLDTESSPVTHQEERGGGWNVSGAGTWERGLTPCPSPLEMERGAGRGALSAPSSPSPFASKWRGGERVGPRSLHDLVEQARPTDRPRPAGIVLRDRLKLVANPRPSLLEARPQLG